MIGPSPQALLVEHPALPELTGACGGTEEPVEPTALAEHDRLAVALQLVAMTALLGDFELWPGRSALRRARVLPTRSGLRAVLPAWPLPLSPLRARLGGGRAASAAADSAALDAIAGATVLDSDVLAAPSDEAGMAFEPVVSRLLGELDGGLDDATARSLWMLRWAMPPEPDQGETLLYAIRDLDAALRLGTAVYRSVGRRGAGVGLELAAVGAAPRTIAARTGPDPVRILVGSPDEELLADRLRLAAGEGAALLVLGRLPRGWTADRPPVFDRDRIATHLSVVGLSPARRVRWLDRLNGRFDPDSPLDRRRLTRAATRGFRGPAGTTVSSFADLTSVAGLAPEGLPVDLVTRLCSSDPDRVFEAELEGAVVVRDGRVALATPTKLGVDPRHSAVSEAYDPGDPRRMLHRALADGNTGPLLEWARGRLDDLDGRAVREVLAAAAPGALGPGVDAALAEACLGLTDVGGARRAVAELADEAARPWRSWIALLDRTPGLEVELPKPADISVAPRACAEIGLVGVRRGLWRNDQPPQDPLELVRAAEVHLRGACRRWVRIRLTARIEPDLLDDPGWRREATGGHPELVGLVMFERAFCAIAREERRLAVRLLERLSSRECSPGRLAPMEITLGALHGDLGQAGRALAATRRARLLFLAAGFRHRVRDADHNLAVADLDALRVERARERLMELARSDGGVFVEVERARLDLAVGDLEGFTSRLDLLPTIDDVAAPPLIEALSLLHGVSVLLAGDPTAAGEHLALGGREAGAWRRLAAAVAGLEDPGEPKEDVWGIGAAGSWLRTLRSDGSGVEKNGGKARPWTVRRALGAAVLQHLGVRVLTAEGDQRATVARVLDDHGLTGWAQRVWWDGQRTERMLSGLSRLIEGGSKGAAVASACAEVLAGLGLTGLMLRRLGDGSVLLLVGEGEAGDPAVRGRLELVPLGGGPASQAAWKLLFDVLESWAPVAISEVLPRSSTEVRIDGVSAPIEELRSELGRIAPTGLPVLIEGETGTGKEVAARELHRLSGRSGELVAVNVAEIPVTLLEAELFGAVKGAFTGAARSRVGLVRSADGGTLLLDEIGDLDGTLQVKLLRFLESGEVRPVGSDRVVKADVRVVCATHRNLDRRVRDGRFREDLFYRIAVARLRMPALRERPEDIPSLLAVLGRDAVDRYGLPPSRWSARARRALLGHHWPGNVRELKHAIEYAIARAGDGTIRVEHLPIRGTQPEVQGSWEVSLAEFKRRLLTEVLGRHRGNRSRAARELGISRQSLLYQVKKLGLEEL